MTLFGQETGVTAQYLTKLTFGKKAEFDAPQDQSAPNQGVLTARGLQMLLARFDHLAYRVDHASSDKISCRFEGGLLQNPVF